MALLKLKVAKLSHFIIVNQQLDKLFWLLNRLYALGRLNTWITRRRVLKSLQGYKEPSLKVPSLCIKVQEQVASQSPVCNLFLHLYRPCIFWGILNPCDK